MGSCLITVAPARDEKFGRRNGVGDAGSLGSADRGSSLASFAPGVRVDESLVVRREQSWRFDALLSLGRFAGHSLDGHGSGRGWGLPGIRTGLRSFLHPLHCKTDEEAKSR